MALGQRLVQRQTQSLVMTQQLTQSIRLLAMSNSELDAFVDEAVERNPLLARVAGPVAPPPRAPASPPAPVGADDPSDVWERMAARPTLADHLHAQIAVAGRRAAVTAAARAMVHDLDRAGYLREPDDLRRRLGVPAATFDEALALMRSLEPAGIGARDLRDCLALQLAARNRLDPAMRALLDNLALLARRDFPTLERVTGLSMPDLLDALAEVRALDPKPAARFDVPPLPVAPPDVLLSEGPRGWRVELNPETLPRVLVDRDYHAAVAPAAAGDARAWLAERMEDAHWLVRAMDQRARTVVAVTAEIARRQDGFLVHGPAHMRPLTLAQVAEAVGVHESTVSRVTTAKTVATPRGVFALKHFFCSGLGGPAGAAHASIAVQERIRAMVAAEGPDVLSDDAMVARLETDGVRIARRTVAKYRERLGIPSSAVRKREARGLADA